MSNSNPQTEMTRKKEKKQNKTNPQIIIQTAFTCRVHESRRLKKQNRRKTNRNFFIHENPNTFHASSNTRTGEKTKETQETKKQIKTENSREREKERGDGKKLKKSKKR